MAFKLKRGVLGLHAGTFFFSFLSGSLKAASLIYLYLRVFRRTSNQDFDLGHHLRCHHQPTSAHLFYRCHFLAICRMPQYLYLHITIYDLLTYRISLCPSVDPISILCMLVVINAGRFTSFDICTKTFELYL
jgi:hypothetical protein